ncbi:carboxymuconolactone decarboxylase family protein [Pseudonocardia acaciae]|uniref:carboxymuconolactone decarboxylase family protein n=1 Tax=Pseudonocardia acaciae TaxID=551276 RepID=UPI00048C771A|nr:carboxymuconolactone decarboxylase family protein [Pseudonocardia acaciae]
MVRIEHVTGDGDVADRIRLRRGGWLTPLDQMLLHSPPVADGWNSLLGAIRRRCELAGDVRELAILRVAALNGADYEWQAHEPEGLAEGLTAEQIAVLRIPAPPDVDADEVLGERLRLARDYTDAMTKDVQVPDELFDKLREHFDDRRIVELTATVGAYNLVSRFLVALQVGVA